MLTAVHPAVATEGFVKIFTKMLSSLLHMRKEKKSALGGGWGSGTEVVQASITRRPNPGGCSTSHFELDFPNAMLVVIKPWAILFEKIWA